MRSVVWPNFWRDFYEHHGLAGREVYLSELIDPQGGGVEFRLLSEGEALDEVSSPGISADVAGLGFFPIGICLIGTGDCYYLRSQDGELGPVYVISSDAIVDESSGTIPSSLIETVMPTAREIPNNLL